MGNVLLLSVAWECLNPATAVVTCSEIPWKPELMYLDSARRMTQASWSVAWVGSLDLDVQELHYTRDLCSLTRRRCAPESDDLAELLATALRLEVVA